MIHFVSDTHFGHENVIKYSKRPFGSGEEMDETMIANWNAVVKESDEVYHLGDVAFAKEDRVMSIFRRLNGRKYLLFGNHDKLIRKSPRIQSMFEWCKDFHELSIKEPGDKDKRKIVLCHYSFQVWNQSHHGSFNLYGHSHGTLPDKEELRSMDVGVDATAGRLASEGRRYPQDYRPISFDEVKRHMKAKKWEPIDHHGEDTEG